MSVRKGPTYDINTNNYACVNMYVCIDVSMCVCMYVDIYVCM